MIICVAAMAQDRIIMNDGSVVLGNVKSISDQDLLYWLIVTDTAGNYYVESTLRIVALENVKSVTLSSGRQLYPREKLESTPRTTIERNPYIFPPYKNPALAYIFSSIPGCGQFYNDEVYKGFGFISAFLAEGLIFTISYNNITTTERRSSYDPYTHQTHYYDEEVTSESAVTFAILSGIALSITYIWSSIDAVITANKLNIANGYVIKASPTVSYNAPVPAGRGSIMAGMSLSLSF